MKKVFDFLATDREPFEYVEHAKVVMLDGKLTALSNIDGQLVRRVIPPASTLLLFLGSGTTISGDAARFAARHDMYVGFVRGGSNVHSVWHCGRWPDPSRVVNQVKRHSDAVLRLETAKELVVTRFERESAPLENLVAVRAAHGVSELLGYEAAWAKTVYRNLATANGTLFVRDQESREGVNGALSLLNNALYSFVTSVILALGLHPSIGFVHGQTRRGGLSFDLADLFKLELTLKPAFEEWKDPGSLQMHRLAERLRMDNGKVVRLIVEFCEKIAGPV